MTFITKVRTNSEARAHLEDWGFELCPRTLDLDARVLDPEVLCFGNGYRETVSPKADWGRTATTKPVLMAVPVNKWAIFFLDKNEAIVRNFCKVLTQQGPKMGMNYATPKVVFLR